MHSHQRYRSSRSCLKTAASKIVRSGVRIRFKVVFNCVIFHFTVWLLRVAISCWYQLIFSSNILATSHLLQVAFLRRLIRTASVWSLPFTKIPFSNHIFWRKFSNWMSLTYDQFQRLLIRVFIEFFKFNQIFPKIFAFRIWVPGPGPNLTN